MDMISDSIALDAPHLALLLVATIACLAAALVWMFCELERRIGSKRAPAALARFGYRPDGGRTRRRDGS